MTKRKLPSKDFWVMALPRIIKRGFATERERDLASDFRSCAVAEARANVSPRAAIAVARSRTPEDNALSDLGYKFYVQLSDGELHGAAATYAEIQGRARVLQLKWKFKV